MSRTKKKKSTIADFNELDKKLFDLGYIETVLAKSEAAMNKEIQKIREKYANNNELVIETKKELLAEIKLFCIENKDQFGKVKSKTLTHGKVGFRFPPPKISLLNKSYSWETVTELLKKIYKNKFVRTVPEPNKERLLIESTGDKPTLTKDDLAAVGLKIGQAEKFYCEPKWEAVEPDGK